MNTVTVYLPTFPTRAPRGAALLAAVAVAGWRAAASVRNWFRQARAAETRPSHG